MEVSVDSATAGKALRSARKRPTNSPAMCWASAAEPPLPHRYSVPPARSDCTIASAIATIVSAAAVSNAATIR